MNSKLLVILANTLTQVVECRASHAKACVVESLILLLAAAAAPLPKKPEPPKKLSLDQLARTLQTVFEGDGKIPAIKKLRILWENQGNGHLELRKAKDTIEAAEKIYKWRKPFIYQVNQSVFHNGERDTVKERDRGNYENIYRLDINGWVGEPELRYS